MILIYLSNTDSDIFNTNSNIFNISNIDSNISNTYFNISNISNYCKIALSIEIPVFISVNKDKNLYLNSIICWLSEDFIFIYEISWHFFKNELPK